MPDAYHRSAATPPRVLRLGIHGAVDDMVVQRDGDRAALPLTSTAAHPAAIRALDGAGAEVACAELAPGAGGTLALPTGGPYRVEATAGGQTELLAEGVLAGDVWLLAGQSNMYGYGLLAGGVEPPHPLVHMLDMARRWRPAEEPLHSDAHSPDPVHHQVYREQGLDLEVARAWQRASGAGLGLSFARQMADATCVPVGLVPVAKGGSAIAEWSPGLRDRGGESLYGSMALSVAAAGGRLRGALWFQGESDTGTVEAARAYPHRLRELVAALRADHGAGLRVLQVQICRNVLIGEADALAWSLLRVAQAAEDTGVDGTVASLDVELDDPIHLGARGLQRIGRRLARLALGRAETIGVAAVERQGTLGPPPQTLHLRVELRGLRGGLAPRLHVPGFSVRTPSGAEVNVVYRAEVLEDDPHAVRLRLSGEPRTPGDALWYGFGANPWCDLADAEDNAVPAFGPIPLQGP